MGREEDTVPLISPLLPLPASFSRAYFSFRRSGLTETLEHASFLGSI